jgi:Gpi18-like mannosyltransferase
VFAVKLITVPVDFVCAALVYKIVRARFITGPAPVFAFLAIVIAPTVFLNSSFWSETDILYTTCLAATLYFLIKEREIPAFLAFGLAFAIKLQALFFLPVLFILWLLRRVSWKTFLLIPLVYLIAITPAWLLGRPLDELLFIY